MVTQLWRLAATLGMIAAAIPLHAQETDYQVYGDPPRLLLNQRRFRLLKRERERESIRWQQFDTHMRGKARMSEPGFSLALWGAVTAQPGACRQAAEWAAKANAADPSELRQIALVYDWCQASVPETLNSLMARKLAAALTSRKEEPAQVRSCTFAALAIADFEPKPSQDFLKFAVETWWGKKIAPRLKAGQSPFLTRRDLYAMVEFIHVIRDNFRVDLREGFSEWFEQLAPLQLLSYYPRPWPAPENEYRIPAYWTPGDPDLQEAALSRAAELALVAFDANAQTHQFLQGWLMLDRFLLRGDFGVTYEFLWANPYQPGLSFTYMPDVFHAEGRLLVRSSWEEDAVWFGYSEGRAQVFQAGKRIAVRPDAQPSPMTLGPVQILFASAGMRFETGWMPAAEEGSRPVEEVAFILGLEPGARHDVEVDGEEMFEESADRGGILELRFAAGRKAGVRVKRTGNRPR